MAAPVTALYLALAGLLVVALAFNVSLRRRAYGIGLGTGERPELAAAVRAHANAVEYLPLGLGMLLVLELNGTPAWLLHGLGLLLLAGRAAHAQGLLVHGGGVSPGRFFGALVTWAVIVAAALLLLWQAASAWLQGAAA